MREFEKKKKSRYFLYSYFVIIPLLVVLFFLIRGTWYLYLKDRSAISELRNTQSRLEKLTERQKTLNTALAKLSTDPGIEAEIRDRLQMAKEGEKEIVIVQNEQNQEELEPIKPTLLQRIVNFFTIR